MAVGLLFGADTNITTRVYDYKTYKTTKQYTTTFAPQTTVMNTYGYNPQIVLGSPQANIGSGGRVTPVSTPQVTTIPQTIQKDEPITKEATMGAQGGTNITDLLIVAGVGLAAILILPKLFKKRKKGVK